MFKKFLRRKPKYLVTYLCHECELDFTKTDLDELECFYCGSKSGFTVLSKENFSAARLETAESQMLFNLKNVYEAEQHDSNH